MKTLLIIAVLSPIALFSQAKTAEEITSQGFKKYIHENGKITYEVSGDATGEEIMLFDRFGWQNMRKQSMVFELYGIKSMQTLHEIGDGDYIYRLNEGDSTYMRRVDFKWSQQAAYKSPDQTSEAILFSLGGNHATDSTLLGKQCQVWVFEGNKALKELWIWDGLVLKRKTKLGDKIVYSTATNIEIGAKPEPSSFIIPSYFKEKENK